MILISGIFAFFDSRKFSTKYKYRKCFVPKSAAYIKKTGDVRVNISCPRVQTEMAGLLPETIAVFIKN